MHTAPLYGSARTSGIAGPAAATTKTQAMSENRRRCFAVLFAEPEPKPKTTKTTATKTTATASATKTKTKNKNKNYTCIRAIAQITSRKKRVMTKRTYKTVVQCSQLGVGRF